MNDELIKIEGAVASTAAEQATVLGEHWGEVFNAGTPNLLAARGLLTKYAKPMNLSNIQLPSEASV